MQNYFALFKLIISLKYSQVKTIAVHKIYKKQNLASLKYCY